MKSTFKLFALLLIILASSCKKDIEDKQNKIIHLTKPSGWLTAKIEEKSATGNWTDITSTIAPFDVDNLLIFDPWYQWAINEGELKLPGNPQIPLQGTWAFANGETKIQFIDGNLLDIIELTETSLIVTTPVGNSTIRYTYKHP